MSYHTVYLGLGANLNDPVAQLQQAVDALTQLPGTRAHRCSAFYASKPMGPQDQPDYVNAVMELQCQLAPHELLDATQAIELNLGRVRKAERWGPRTLDIDILLFGTECIDDERLTVPHYGMKVREFVLYPLFELAPELELPNGSSVRSLTTQVPRNGLEQLQ
ncbi:2-amino-4-hydroxy-6-hydroxymethyldihydropteridine diphosphokinase [Pseudoalteromonas sp. T1lg48]|uniref:2-amino-4-hydroxy-6- hydroxymethyldihydropteridine diphosphokinase n=1 Tax=Pseudoalteromonas sp. T1lg48 TaxID=2077100 RepID=UPI000CF7208E|nr:2-amino-4-hydroxy-6-hydroxymethyldihydropteridine diphosphokinase [Pseudoalteromonas sp. T1lg48]